MDWSESADVVTLVLLDQERRWLHYDFLFRESRFQCVPFDHDRIETLIGRHAVGICSEEFGAETTLRIAALKSKGIAVCHLLDGILDWRNLFENPRSQCEDRGMPLYQPIVADVVACMGPWQQLLLGWLGNSAKSVATGLPRLDRYCHLLQDTSSGTRFSRPNVMLCSANTAGFNNTQVASAVRALSGVRDWFEAKCPVPVNLSWRVSPAIAADVGASPPPNVDADVQIRQADIVVTTPSTMALESMLCGKPTCVVDYTNSPALLLSAWSVNSVCQLDEVLSNLVAGCSRRMSLQRFLLQQQVVNVGTAGARLADLLYGMALSLPVGDVLPTEDPTLIWRLNPAHPTFRQFNLSELQMVAGNSLNVLRRCAALETENHELKERLSKMRSTLVRPSLFERCEARIRRLLAGGSR